MNAIVKYLRSDSGLQENCKILHTKKDKVYDFIRMSEGQTHFVVKWGKREIKIPMLEGVILIPYAVNNEYRINETVYCYDSITDDNDVIHKGFFASLSKIDKENKNMFGIEPLIGASEINLREEPNKLYWSNEVVNVVGAIHPEIDWISRGAMIEASRENCQINTKLRVSTNLKVKCPTCKTYHPNK